MPHTCDKSNKFEKLRQRAIELIQKQPDARFETNGNMLDLVQELKIYQAELEIQNQNLGEAHEEIYALQQEYFDLYEFAPCGYVRLNDRQIISKINLAAVSLLGTTRNVALRHGLGLFLDNPWDNLYSSALLKAAKTGEPQKVDLLLKQKEERSPLWVSADIAADINKKKEAIQWRIVLSDITRQKQAEQERTQALETAAENEKQALVGRVAGKLAHDFNNILAAIMGNAELAIPDCRDKEIKKTLELIFEQTQRGKNLTRNLVAFARDMAPRQEFFSINKKIDLVMDLLKKDLQGIDVMRQFSHDLPELFADPGMVEHCLVNLIQNSIHAVSFSHPPWITVKTFLLDNNICINVVDNGCGIPEKHMKNIYEPAFTLKGSFDETGSYKNDIKGTGYGLANVKKYIEEHKGSFAVDSQSGSGTKVTIRIPIVNKDLISKGKKDFLSKPNLLKALKNKKILLVEDEESIVNFQYQMLTRKPYSHKVDLAYNGQSALDLFEKKQYDIVSLDYTLPGDLNGMDVYMQMRKKDEKIPVLFLSGNIEFIESIKELKHKDDKIEHLPKPCSNKEYIKTINTLLEKNIDCTNY